LVGEKLYVYGVVCTAAAKKNSIIKIDRRWLCRGFGQGPKLVSVSQRNICTNIQYSIYKKRNPLYLVQAANFRRIYVCFISKRNTRFGNDLAVTLQFSPLFKKKSCCAAKNIHLFIYIFIYLSYFYFKNNSEGVFSFYNYVAQYFASSTLHDLKGIGSQKDSLFEGQ
jgi:hypothetical protein